MANAGNARLDSVTGAVPIEQGGTANVTASAALAALGGVGAASPTFTGAFSINSITSGINAGSTQTQAGATALTSFFNQIGTVTTQYDGVKLPTAVAGLMVAIQNVGAQNCKIWPASGDDLGEGVNLGKTWSSSGAGSKFAWFLALDDTTWVRWQGESLSTPI